MINVRNILMPMLILGYLFILKVSTMKLLIAIQSYHTTLFIIYQLIVYKVTAAQKDLIEVFLD